MRDKINRGRHKRPLLAKYRQQRIKKEYRNPAIYQPLMYDFKEVDVR